MIDPTDLRPIAATLAAAMIGNANRADQSMVEHIHTPSQAVALYRQILQELQK